MQGPVVISAAIFASIVFLDLFRHEYKRIPVHAILGVFTVVLMSFLCDTNRFLIAWIILFTPFIILGLGLMIRNRNKGSTAYPAAPLEAKKAQGAPYFL
jgi:tetrahydromethanopterin S-methyltransferase subunit E